MSGLTCTSLVRERCTAVLPALRLHVHGQLVWLTEKTATSTMLWSLALVVRHEPRLNVLADRSATISRWSSLITSRPRLGEQCSAKRSARSPRRRSPLWRQSTGRSRPQMARDRVLVGRYHPSMAHVTKLTKSEVERRRAAAERMRGLFADVAPDRSLVDELIADRRAEAAESGESAVRRRRGG